MAVTKRAHRPAMHNTIRNALAALVVLLPSLTMAQDAEPAPAAPESAAAPGTDSPATSTPTPTSDEPAAVEPVLTPVAALEERLAGVEAKLAGAEETLSAHEAAVSGFKKVKLSGYIQGRYEWYDASTNAVDLKSISSSNTSGTTTNKDRFLVRRARLKATYAGRNSEYLFQIDATGDGVTLKDAEATFVDTWTPFNMRLTVGQFKLPFGHEVLQSSGDREMGERSGIVRAYFDGERDRGMRLQARYEFLRLAVALVNGNGVRDVYTRTNLYGTNDPNGFKDFVGRLGVDFGSVVGGVSAYLGRGLTAVGTPASGTTPASVVYDSRRRTRLGADVQVYQDIPGVGGLAVKGEFIWGSDWAIDFNGAGSDASKNLRQRGFIVTVVQNIGDQFGVVARLDELDPDTSKDKNKITTLGGGLLVHASNNLKATLVYEHPMEEGTKKDNDVFMAQLQAKF